MALDNVSLNKFLKISRKNLPQRISLIKRDAREALRKEKKVEDKDGGDFYTAFWGDAKQYVLEGLDLKLAVAARVSAHASKKKLYPILCKEFLRWFGSEFDASDYNSRNKIDKVFGKCVSLCDDGAIRVHGLLAWKDPSGKAFIIYPYFDKDMKLGSNTARLARWAMSNALPDHQIENMIVLDVIRGNAFDNDNAPLIGDEENTLSDQYTRMMREWQNQKRLLRSI